MTIRNMKKTQTKKNQTKITKGWVGSDSFLVCNLLGDLKIVEAYITTR